jgi:hypothetical protein
MGYISNGSAEPCLETNLINSKKLNRAQWRDVLNWLSIVSICELLLTVLKILIILVKVRRLFFLLQIIMFSFGHFLCPF